MIDNRVKQQITNNTITRQHLTSNHYIMTTVKNIITSTNNIIITNTDINIIKQLMGNNNQ